MHPKNYGLVFILSIQEPVILLVVIIVLVYLKRED